MSNWREIKFFQKCFLLVRSWRIIRLMRTVNKGEEDLIVATKETAIYFKEIKPKTIVAQRYAPIYNIWRNTFFMNFGFRCKELSSLVKNWSWMKPLTTDMTSWFAPERKMNFKIDEKNEWMSYLMRMHHHSNDWGYIYWRRVLHPKWHTKRLT